MANAVHLHARITAQQSDDTGTLATKQTVTAAELTTAGFADGDEALVLWWFKAAAGVSAAYSVIVDLKYGGATVLAASPPTLRLTATGRERAHLVMARVALGTLADFTVQLATGGAPQAALMEKSELVIVRLADFGTEDVDWFWNEAVGDVTNTTTYSGTSRATETWTPAEVEDWVTLAYVHHDIVGTAINAEGQVTLDAVLHSGDWSMEGESGAEEWPHSWWGLLASLAASSHTLTVETRDDTATAANIHRESALFVFRKAVWADVYTNLPGTVAVANATDVQVATITDTLSAAQPLVVIGQGNMNLDTVDTQAYLWVRQDGATILDPQGDTAAALANGYAFDATDEVLLTTLSYVASESGAQDLDLFASQSDASSRNLLSTGLLVWGMALAEPPPPEAEVTMTWVAGGRWA